MARLNFKEAEAGGREFQAWIIEDSWEGSRYIEARLLRTWQGLCGSNKLLEDREGRFYWWVVFFTPEAGRALQRVVTFLDWDSLAAELGLQESSGTDVWMAVNSLH
jgi:hypothetical protein